jgi:hypothetical protein
MPHALTQRFCGVGLVYVWRWHRVNFSQARRRSVTESDSSSAVELCFSKRFGLVHVDSETRHRVPRASTRIFAIDRYARSRW